MKKEFALPVGSLILRLSRVCPLVVFQVQLPVPHRQMLALFALQALEEIDGLGEPGLRYTWEVPHDLDVFQHLGSRPAAAIAMSVRHEQRWPLSGCPPILLLKVGPGVDDLLSGSHRVVSADLGICV